MTAAHNSNHNAGFTVAELLIAILIVSLMAILVLPVTRGPPAKATLHSTATTLAGQLRLARADAIRKNKDQVLAFDTTRRTFHVPGVTTRKKIPDSVALRFETLQKERINPTQGQIRFHPDGSATGGRFVLKTGQQSARVTVDWMTGHVGMRYAEQN